MRQIDTHRIYINAGKVCGFLCVLLVFTIACVPCQADAGAIDPIRRPVPVLRSGELTWGAMGWYSYGRLGCSVSSAGDVNGDGYDDVIIGAKQDYDKVGRLGTVGNVGVVTKVYVYYGGPSGAEKEPAWETSIRSVGLGAKSIRVASAGDVNNDGYADVIISAEGVWDAGGASFPTSVMVFHGSTDGLGDTPDWELDVHNDFIEYYDTTFMDMREAAFYDMADFLDIKIYIGWDEFVDNEVAVSSAGDVNGDGYDDIIIGMPHHTRWKINEGRAEVYYGSTEGLEETPGWSFETEIGDSDFIKPVPCPGGTGPQFGYSVAGAGDINGDGYDDIVIGAPKYILDQDQGGGAIAVAYGSPSGPTKFYQACSYCSQPWIFLTGGLNGQYDMGFGSSVSGAGDVNGDGYDDVIVGAPLYDTGENGKDRGLVTLLFGSSAGLRGKRVRWVGGTDNGQLGRTVAAAGDVNGDGYADFIVRYLNNKVFVGYGNANYHNMTSCSGPARRWTKEVTTEDARFGASVSSAGDVNGDGKDEVIIGAPLWNLFDGDEGAAFIYTPGRTN